MWQEKERIEKDKSNLAPWLFLCIPPDECDSSTAKEEHVRGCVPVADLVSKDCGQHLVAAVDPS